ncbi:hypothetical protein [Flammeovirga agarivorans]|uniref:Uncharacterized protein n=1 Tax=Flammeovirga agarivorans TaxID=2726742 RepID=A0A7X8SRE9_9BACT|nr:hypothetical protein [Flammeovirga agarivorans]NLR94898.1 hypothetical protein [Flammeovirga agarivorans]
MNVTDYLRRVEEVKENLKKGKSPKNTFEMEVKKNLEADNGLLALKLKLEKEVQSFTDERIEKQLEICNRTAYQKAVVDYKESAKTLDYLIERIKSDPHNPRFNMSHNKRVLEVEHTETGIEERYYFVNRTYEKRKKAIDLTHIKDKIETLWYDGVMSPQPIVSQREGQKFPKLNFRLMVALNLEWTGRFDEEMPVYKSLETGRIVSKFPKVINGLYEGVSYLSSNGNSYQVQKNGNVRSQYGNKTKLLKAATNGITQEYTDWISALHDHAFDPEIVKDKNVEDGLEVKFPEAHKALSLLKRTLKDLGISPNGEKLQFKEYPLSIKYGGVVVSPLSKDKFILSNGKVLSTEKMIDQLKRLTQKEVDQKVEQILNSKELEELAKEIY